MKKNSQEFLVTILIQTMKGTDSHVGAKETVVDALMVKVIW